MIENIDILFRGTGQLLEFTAPEGRPDCIVNSTVFENVDSDDDVSEAALVGTALLDAQPNTTFNNVSGQGEADPSVAHLTAIDGIVKGRRYLVTDIGSEQEWVEVREVNTLSFVELRHPLNGVYQTNDTFQTTRITQPLSETWTSDEDNLSDRNCPTPRYRWRLEYLVDCVTCVHAIYFDLVRYKTTYSVSALDVDRAFPGWIDNLPTRHREDRGGELIRESYRQVKLDMAATGKADQMARNREIVEDLVIHKAALLSVHARLYTGAPLDPTAVDIANARYTERLQNFVIQAGLQFDEDGDGAADGASRTPLWRR